MTSIVSLTPTQIDELTQLVFVLIEANTQLTNSIPVLNQKVTDLSAQDTNFKDIHEAIEQNAILFLERERKFLTGPEVTAAEVVSETKIVDSVNDPYVNPASTHPLYPNPGGSPPSPPLEVPRQDPGLFGGSGTEPDNEQTEKALETADITTLLGFP